MADIPNRIVLENANTDCGTLSQVISGAANTKVTTRLGQQYWTLATIDFKVNAVETLATQAIQSIDAKVAGGYFKTYVTLADANADIANIPLNVTVKTTDSGDYYKLSSDATSLTKSPYDPFQQSKDYTDTEINQIINTTGSDILHAWSDASGNSVGYIDNFGSWVIDSPKLLSEAAKLVGAEVSDITDDLHIFEDNKGNVVLRIDNNGNIFDGNNIQINIASEQTVEKTMPFENVDFLRETKRKIQQIKRGMTSTQLSISMIGDSWTDTPLYFSKELAEQMRAIQGDAGVGYCAFRLSSGALFQPCTDITKLTYSSSGTWTSNNFTKPSAHISSISSSTVGSKLTFGNDGNSVKLHHLGGSGVVQYRYNAGSWVNLTLDGSGFQIKTLSAPPAGSWTLEIEVVSGTVELYGLDIRKTSNGVRFNKLGQSSTYLSQWTAVDATAWKSAFASLDADLTTIMFGTNDKYQYDADTFAAHLQTMIERVKQARPTSDILVIMPPDGLSGDKVSKMTDLSKAARKVARGNRCAFLDFQQYFGNVPASNYADASGLVYFSSVDENHPYINGRAVLTEVLIRILLNIV